MYLVPVDGCVDGQDCYWVGERALTAVTAAAWFSVGAAVGVIAGRWWKE
jgi:hypothetical protein